MSFDTTKEDLTELFGQHGQVTDVHIPTDRDTGRVRGFAFVTLDSTEAMNSAIEAIHGMEVGGRTLKVNEAQPRQ